MKYPIDIFPLPVDWPTYVPETFESEHSLSEIVSGRRKERPTSFASRHAANELAFALHRRVVGLVADLPFLACFAWEPDRRRRPDVAYWRDEDLLRDLPHNVDLAVVPDFIAESVPAEEPQSSRDGAIYDYLRAGVRVVWRLDVYKRRVVKVKRDGQEIVWPEESIIDAESYFSGEPLAVADLFRKIQRV